MSVYLLHLETPLDRGVSPSGKPLTAGHYIGYAFDLAGRFAHHCNGTGARFTQICVERGCKLELVRVWEGADRTFERKLKAYKNGPLLCPICSPGAMHRMEA